MIDIEKIKAAQICIPAMKNYLQGAPDDNHSLISMCFSFREWQTIIATLEAGQGLIDKPLIEGGGDRNIQSLRKAAEKIPPVRHHSPAGTAIANNGWWSSGVHAADSGMPISIITEKPEDASAYAAFIAAALNLFTMKEFSNMNITEPLMTEEQAQEIREDMPINALLPCPFCGGVAEEGQLIDERDCGGSVIQCKKCFASSQVQFGYKETLREMWNRRALSPALVKEGVVEALDRVQLWASQLDPSDPLAIDQDAVLELASFTLAAPVSVQEQKT